VSYYKSLPINNFFEEITAMQNNLGFIYAAQGNYPKAIANFEKALEV
jgi:tetratricopeptide (TPR) repeat protein